MDDCDSAGPHAINTAGANDTGPSSSTEVITLPVTMRVAKDVKIAVFMGTLLEAQPRIDLLVGCS